MSRITFRDLVSLLPKGSDLRAQSLPTGLSYVTDRNPRFVEPNLDVHQPIELGKTSVVLISAPGAVGKSTLAAELASTTEAPLWDLSRINVGSKTFHGTVLDAYEFFAPGVLKRFKDGEFLFVLDALDEAQVRAGSQNFDAFLHDIAGNLREARSRPTAVLLARSDTADWIHLLLEEEGVPLARYQVAYFDEAQAISFIDKRLDDLRERDGAQLIHRQQKGPYTQARGELFNLIYGLFQVPSASPWHDKRVRDFLGYAPVLEALTDYLDVTNYMSLLQELQQDGRSAGDPWQFLAGIISRLQQREHTKVQVAVRSLLETTAKASQWHAWGDLYEPAEQCARVLGHTLQHPFDGSVAKLPSDLRLGYEQALRTILPQHPFLSGRSFANVVFKEFAYAWGITRGGPILAQRLRGAMADREEPFLPSPLFSRFVFSLFEDHAAVVDGQDFGIVYESMLSRAVKVELSLIQTADVIEASVLLVGDEGHSPAIQLIDTGPGIHFWRRLHDADISVDCGLRLGSPDQRFVLGSAVDIDCGELSVQCEELDVDVQNDVRIRATSLLPSSSNVRIRVRNPDMGRLGVLWPNMGHPWVTYRAEKALGPLTLADTPRGEALRKLILMFRRQRSRREQTVRNARWSPSERIDRDELLGLALDRGVLRSASIGASLEFNSDYDSLKTLVSGEICLSSKAAAFVAEFLGAAQLERMQG